MKKIDNKCKDCGGFFGSVVDWTKWGVYQQCLSCKRYIFKYKIITYIVRGYIRYF